MTIKPSQEKKRKIGTTINMANQRIFFFRAISAPTYNKGNIMPQPAKRGVAARYRDMGSIRMEDI